MEVKHPIYIGSKVPIVQTIDFVTTTSDDKHIAYAVKQESDALRERTIEKLMLQEAYCKLQGIEFELVTSNDIRTIKSENLEALYRHRNISPFQKSIFEIWLSNFLGILSEDRHNRISNIIKTSSEATGISYFQAASYFYYSLWNEYLNINWNQRLKLESPASVLKLSPYEQAV